MEWPMHITMSKKPLSKSMFYSSNDYCKVYVPVLPLGLSLIVPDPAPKIIICIIIICI